MELTLFGKILWALWILMVSDLAVDWVEKIPVERARLYTNGVFGLATIATIIAIALLPFANFIFFYE